MKSIYSSLTHICSCVPLVTDKALYLSCVEVKHKNARNQLRHRGISWWRYLPFELAIRTSLSDVELRQKGTSNIGYNVLNNGLVCPIVGISTSHENILFESIKQGVRLIDTSLCNQAEIAGAITQGDVFDLLR